MSLCRVKLNSRCVKLLDGAMDTTVSSQAPHHSHFQLTCIVIQPVKVGFEGKQPAIEHSVQEDGVFGITVASSCVSTTMPWLMLALCLPVVL